MRGRTKGNSSGVAPSSSKADRFQSHEQGANALSNVPGKGSFSGRRSSVESDESSDGSSLELLYLGVAERFIERFLLGLVVSD